MDSRTKSAIIDEERNKVKLVPLLSSKVTGISESEINMALKDIIGGAKTVAQRGMALFSAENRQKASAALTSIQTANGGKPIEPLFASKNPTTQSALLAQMFKSGMKADTFAEAAQLTSEELRQYAAVIEANHVAQTNEVDAHQNVRSSTGDAFIDGLSTNRDIGEICIMLGITSDKYAKLIRGINTHTSKDVERYQLEMSMRSGRRG